MDVQKTKRHTSYFVKPGQNSPKVIHLKGNKLFYLFLFTASSSVGSVFASLSLEEQLATIARILSLLSLGVVIYSVANLFMENTKFRIDHNGIFIRNKGQFSWTEIELTEIEIQKFDMGDSWTEIAFLVIELNNNKKVIEDLSLLKLDFKEVACSIESLRPQVQAEEV